MYNSLTITKYVHHGVPQPLQSTSAQQALTQHCSGLQKTQSGRAMNVTRRGSCAEYMKAVGEWKGRYKGVVEELERREFLECMARNHLRAQYGQCEEPPLWLLQV